MTRLRKVLLESLGRIPIGWWAIPLRLIVGYGFMAHGFAKLSRGPNAFVGILHALGVPAPYWGRLSGLSAYRWLWFSSWRCSRCTCHMALVPSSSSP